MKVFELPSSWAGVTCVLNSVGTCSGLVSVETGLGFVLDFNEMVLISDSLAISHVLVLTGMILGLFLILFGLFLFYPFSLGLGLGLVLV